MNLKLFHIKSLLKILKWIILIIKEKASTNLKTKDSYVKIKLLALALELAFFFF